MKEEESETLDQTKTNPIEEQPSESAQEENSNNLNQENDNKIKIKFSIADKWKENPERQESFFLWIKQLHNDLYIEDMMNRDRVVMGNSIKESFGRISGTKIFGLRGMAEAKAVKKGELKINTSTGNLIETGTKIIPPSRHYGDA